jgi:signal peptidase I
MIKSRLHVLIVSALSFTVLWFVQFFALKVYYIPSSSMEPTLMSTGNAQDRILVDKISKLVAPVNTGQIVVFRKPATWMAPAERAAFTSPSAWRVLSDITGLGKGVGNVLVKRVIATGGETVGCCNTGGSIEVDGKPVGKVVNDFPFVPGVLDCKSQPESQRCFSNFVVPENHLFVLGDNRMNSADSLQKCRVIGAHWPRCINYVPEQNVIGKVAAIVFPLNRIHWF